MTAAWEFNAGGCASCHAVPKQEDRLKLGGGLPLTSPFGTFYAPKEKDRWPERYGLAGEGLAPTFIGQTINPFLGK